MKPFRLGLIVVLTVSLLLSACSAKQKTVKLEGAQPDAPVESDGGWACKQGDWIYFINGDNYTREQERFDPLRGALCRMRTDGQETAVVAGEDVSLFNIRGEFIYYVAYEDGKSVSYRICSDGTGKKKLAAFDSIYSGGGYAFCDDVIYYVKDTCLYRMKVDGSGQEKLTKYGVYNLRASGRYLYFTQSLSGEQLNLGPLYRLSKSEAEPEKLTDKAAYTLYIKNETVYYYLPENGYCYALDENTLQSRSISHSAYEEYLFIDELNLMLASYTNEEESGVYAIPLSGGERTKISEDKASRMLYYNQYVYYINATEIYSLYRMKADGTQRTELTADMVSDLDDLDETDGWIYYFSENDDGRIYRIRTDDFYVECIQLEEIGVVGG